MNSSQIFTKRAYVFNANNETKKGSVSFSIIDKIIEDLNLGLTIDKAYIIDSNEDCDEYKIESNSKLYTIKVSLDEECFVIKNETYFLKNNHFPLCPYYVSSGSKKIGEKLLFLVTSFEDAFDIRDIGVLSTIENWDSFFYTLYHFGNLKSETSIDEYVDVNFKRNLPENWSDFLKSKISSIHNFTLITKIFEIFNGELDKNFDKNILVKDKVCHGDLGLDSVVFRDEYYKFKNLGLNFIGNPIIDVCFFILSSGFSEEDALLFFKKYCDYNEISFFSSKDEFDHCMRFSVCVYFSNMFYDFLIEESVFSNSRPERFAYFCTNFSKSFRFLKHVESFDKIERILTKIITRPILSNG